MRVRAWIGAAVGGVLGAMVAGPVGAAIGLAAGGALGHNVASKPSAAHKKTHMQAMHSTASPAELRALARKLEPVRLDGALNARAALRENPNPAHRIVLKAMASSQNPAEITAASCDFKKKGAQATAELLRDYARGLRAVEAAGGGSSHGQLSSHRRNA